ncbi:MAG: tyrosine-type recombinase/integrase [Pontimonas sp.]
MKRRLNNEGSVSFDKNRERYVARTRVKDENGESTRLYFYGSTSAEALEKMRSAQRRIRDGKPAADARLTLASWLQEWSEGPLEISARKESTKDGYRYMLRHVLNHQISKKELRKILPTHIQGFIADLRKTSLASSTVHHVYAAMKVALNDAVINRQIGNNPFDNVTPPPRKRTQSVFLTKEQTRELVDAARDNRYYVAVKLLAETGLRRGEALALRWTDIDLEKQTLWVRGTLARTDQGLYVTSPKTQASVRQIHLPAHLIELLKSHLLAQSNEIVQAGNKYVQKGFVFATRTGEPVDPRNLQRSVQIACKKAGLPVVSPHTLRHSAATTMLEAGIPIHVVSRQLGHSNISITVDIYGHVSDKGAKEAMETLGRLLND